jgi:uncharacterized membrane protein YphA (DoxX/SURF4 family)
VIALIALRLGVGWHFFKEGSKKFSDLGVPTVGFLRSATGPLGDTYKSFIPDRYGRQRLSLKSTVSFWNQYKDRAAQHYGFDNKQLKKADEIVARYQSRLDNYLKQHASDLHEYFLEVERLETARQERTRSVPFQRSRIRAKEDELWGKSAVWLGDVRTLSEQLRNDLADLATDAQRARGVYPIADRSTPHAMDTTIKYLVISVGVLLVVGLFTRLASLGGILFLGSVMASQPPWIEGANTQFFYYQLVEVLALFVLFAMAAGRFGGLDYVIHGLYRRCCPSKVHQL